MSRRFSILVLVVTGLYFTLFFVWPIAETLRGAFVTNDGILTLAYLLEVFRNPIYLEGLSNAFLLARRWRLFWHSRWLFLAIVSLFLARASSLAWSWCR